MRCASSRGFFFSGRQLHRGVAGKVAVGGILRTLDVEADGGAGRHCFEGFADQERDLVFQRMGVGHVY